MAVGAFEDLMGELLRKHLQLHQSALGSEEKDLL